MNRILAAGAAITILALGAVFMNVANAEESVDAELTASIAQLNPEQKAALLVLVKSIVDAQVTESPTEGAMKTVAAYVKAAEEANIEILMDQISNDFSHYEVGDKLGYQNFLEQAKAEGYLEDIMGNIEDAKAEVDGDTVTVYPVELEGLFGTGILEFELKKEGDVWKITSLEMTGV